MRTVRTVRLTEKLAALVMPPHVRNVHFGLNGLRCPRCGGIVPLRTVVVGPPAITKILASMARSARAPP